MDSSNVKNAVETCASELDACVKTILDTDINSINTCKKCILDLHKAISTTIDKQAALTCTEISAKEERNKVYNQKYLAPEMDKQKPTAADLTAYAENAVSDIQETIDTYAIASKVVGAKLDNAFKLLSNLEKLLDTFKVVEPAKKVLNE